MTALRVTDHALVRFLQRSGGPDLETLRTLLSESLTRAAVAAENIGVSDYTIRADGLTYVVKNGVVVTVLGASAFVDHGGAR